MLVSIISECSGAAWTRTRRILDRVFERTGERTWHGRMTEEGLDRVRTALIERASKNTSVAAHRAVGHRKFELEGIVGSGRLSVAEGRPAPYVGGAYRKYLEPELADQAWRPWLSAVVEIAALWHDVGKANAQFLDKVRRNAAERDDVRHEILSVLAFCDAMRALCAQTDRSPPTVEAHIRNALSKPQRFTNTEQTIDIAPADLPAGLRYAAWLIATHHRLTDACLNLRPVDEHGDFLLTRHSNPNAFHGRDVIVALDERVLSPHLVDETARLLPIVLDAPPWFPDWRFVAGPARLAMILADRLVSRATIDETEHPQGLPAAPALIANTRQTLEEHLRKVAMAAPVCFSDALQVGAAMPALEPSNLPKRFREKAPPRFAWQNEAVAALRARTDANRGFFGVLAAATGSGKTRAGAKIMSRLRDKTRFIVAMPLRTLTLQAGDEYRADLGLSRKELRVVIGDTAVSQLHGDNIASGSAYGFDLSQGLEIDDEFEKERADLFDMPGFLNKHLEDDWKARRLLGAPILIATVDQLMAAAAMGRTSWIIAALRLMSSDLLIDEADTFGETDIVAVGRLVYMAGVFGRNVVLSSASLPPAQVEGYFAAYKAGREAYARTFGAAARIDVGFFADTPGSSQLASEVTDIAAPLRAFYDTLAAANLSRPRARVARFLPEVTSKDEQFRQIADAIHALHAAHHTRENSRSPRYSAVLVRFAHVRSCIAFARYLDAAPSEADIRIVTYHSRFPLLVRDEIERFLDTILQRKKSGLPNDPRLKSWLRTTRKEDAILVVIASPVEEVGRDHDFDSGVIEPTASKSIIQTAGRINRHRNHDVSVPNIALMAKPMRALDGDRLPYSRPGVEAKAARPWKAYELPAQTIETLASHPDFDPITANPRLAEEGHGALAGLEHEKLRDFLSLDVYQSLAMFHSERTRAYLAHAHAATMRFRASRPSVDVFLDPSRRAFFALDGGSNNRSATSLISVSVKPTIQRTILNLGPHDLLERRFEISAKSDPARFERSCIRYLRMNLVSEGSAYSYDINLGAGLEKDETDE